MKRKRLKTNFYWFRLDFTFCCTFFSISVLHQFLYIYFFSWLLFCFMTHSAYGVRLYFCCSQSLFSFEFCLPSHSFVIVVHVPFSFFNIQITTDTPLIVHLEKFCLIVLKCIYVCFMSHVHFS